MDSKARTVRDNGDANPRRFSIVGATGSGKTHLARALADRLQLPLFELDDFRWDSSGRELPREDFIDAVRKLATREEWIIDGHYREVRHLIWDFAEVVVWLNYPLHLVAARLLRRFRRKRKAGRARADASNLPQQPQITWADRLWRIGRTIRERGEYRRLLHAPEYRHVRIVELKSPRAADSWLREAGRSAAQER
jgi:adenylate kinase family enzyme